MKDLFTFDTFNSPELEEKPQRLTFLQMLELEWQLALRQWANYTKRELLKARQVELQLERQQQQLGGPTLWPLELSPGVTYLPPPAAMEPQPSREMVEALALRAATWLSSVAPAQVDAAYEQWRQELHRRLPSFTAAEVERRVEEFRRVL